MVVCELTFYFADIRVNNRFDYYENSDSPFPRLGGVEYAVALVYTVEKAKPKKIFNDITRAYI